MQLHPISICHRHNLGQRPPAVVLDSIEILPIILVPRERHSPDLGGGAEPRCLRRTMYWLQNRTLGPAEKDWLCISRAEKTVYGF